MKKGLSFLLAFTILFSTTAFAAAPRLPDALTFYEILGIDEKSDVRYGTIEFVQDLNNTVADLSSEDIETLLNSVWEFGYALEVGGEPQLQPNDCFINLWIGEKDTHNSENRTKYTLYPNRIAYDGFGERMSAGGYSFPFTTTAVWYTAKGNGANAIYKTFHELAEKYRDNARKQDQYDGIELFWTRGDAMIVDGASDWAVTELKAAGSFGMVPYAFTEHYQRGITREEFCVLAYQFLSVVKGSNVLALLSDDGTSLDQVTYRDMEYIPYEIRFLTTINVIQGKDGGRFEPTAKISREEAATILHRMAKTLCVASNENTEPNCSDFDTVSRWAQDAVTAMYHAGVMKGYDDGGFYPKEGYTREQSIVTMLRLYYFYHSYQSLKQ